MFTKLGHSKVSLKIVDNFLSYQQHMLNFPYPKMVDNPLKSPCPDPDDLQNVLATLLPKDSL